MRVLPVALLLAALAALSACSDGDDGDGGGQGRSTTTKREITGEITLALGEVQVHGLDGAPGLGTDNAAAVLKVAQRYVNLGTVEALLDGDVGDDFASLFALTVVNRVGPKGPDRTTLADGGVPVATGNLRGTPEPVRVDALVGTDGVPILAIASFSYRVQAPVKGGDATIDRSAELTMEPLGGGKWAITAYRVTTRRDLPGKPATTSSTSAS